MQNKTSHKGLLKLYKILFSEFSLWIWRLLYVARYTRKLIDEIK